MGAYPSKSLQRSCLSSSASKEIKDLSPDCLQGDYADLVWNLESSLIENDRSDVPSTMKHVASSSRPTYEHHVYSFPSCYALIFEATIAAEFIFGYSTSSFST